MPIGKGLLQGKHQFGGLGWLQIIDGVGPLFDHAADGICAGRQGGRRHVCGGGRTIDYRGHRRLADPRTLADPRRLLHSIGKPGSPTRLPLTLGLGTVLVMSSIDMLFVQGLFSDTGQTALYGGAMLTGFAIIQFIAPVALVMFARVAKNVARAERADSLGMTLAATILFGCMAAVGCTLFPKLPLRLMYFSNREMWEAAPLVPWFAWALLPLTVANVLVQNILARGRFRAVPWLVLVPCVYAACFASKRRACLTMKPFDAFIRVIQTFGCASLLLCALAAWFSRGHARRHRFGSGFGGGACSFR